MSEAWADRMARYRREADRLSDQGDTAAARIILECVAFADHATPTERGFVIDATDAELRQT